MDPWFQNLNCQLCVVFLWPWTVKTLFSTIPFSYFCGGLWVSDLFQHVMAKYFLDQKLISYIQPKTSGNEAPSSQRRKKCQPDINKWKQMELNANLLAKEMLMSLICSTATHFSHIFNSFQRPVIIWNTYKWTCDVKMKEKYFQTKYCLYLKYS